jgi:5-methylcytosine-specific restriction enzyme subunit McrC
LRRLDGSTALIAEIKNVPVKELSERGHVEQAVTYAVSYGIERVLLIHPCGSGQAGGLSLKGTIGRIAVYQYLYDLSAIDLAGAEDEFGRAIHQLATDGQPINSPV